ncbi:hypothetical protein ABMA28_005774 [Loxostege sticticalis]|uniref:Peptidase M12A domain-containing protein n=1 Tax=Loxostege sticticalis TaxID=481309 RepID=A0ABD0SMU1_LOXSC
MKLQNKSQLYQNWIINLFVVLCNFNTIISQPCPNETDINLPDDWPCIWNNGTIPFVFNFYSVNPRKLRNLVRKGHDFLHKRSCLKFVERNPVTMARMPNTTYLFYSYSGALEVCCLHYYAKQIGRRNVLITPICTLPAEVAHATLHGMGIEHQSREPIPEVSVRAALFVTNCSELPKKVKNFGLR